MTTGRRNGERALVIGGAGLIGSHLTDGLLEEGYAIRILDNLEPGTHRNGKPPWVPKEAEFLHADVRDPRALRSVLKGVDIVFHEAAYGGYMSEISKYVEVNALGTARLLETIRDENLPVRKLVVASSQPSTAMVPASAPSTASSSPRVAPSTISRVGTTPSAAPSPAAGSPRSRSRPPRRPLSAARRSTR